MYRNAGLGAVLVATAMMTGCVDRKFLITATPAGAVPAAPGAPLPDLGAAVYRYGTYIGVTPVDDPFIYYGKYEFTLVKDGFEPVVLQVPIKTPWYEFIPIDFFSENVVPFWIRDHRPLNFTLNPKVQDNEAAVLHRAEELQTRGRSIGAPRVEPPPPVPPGTTPPVMPPAADTVPPRSP